ncbi:hypothetical protein P5673_015763 [Acropora cervicornis]|uniref:Uncharacterized protein n=1 Tax=Acropora cervicornis TaxID=6130 RepID=A0AAD9QH72_ACRCE|nr:hypothetical protein P5673_015763 [Acropora cervicornis]
MKWLGFWVSTFKFSYHRNRQRVMSATTVTHSFLSTVYNHFFHYCSSFKAKYRAFGIMPSFFFQQISCYFLAHYAPKILTYVNCGKL